MSFSGILKFFIILIISFAILINVNDAANTEKKQDPKCLLPMEPGPCRMSLNRFYYNAETDTCEEFKFGGCKGNDNKFGFKQTCEEACKKSSASPTTSDPKSSGNAGTTSTTTERSTLVRKNLKSDTLKSLTSNVEETTTTTTTIKPRLGARTTPKLRSATSRSSATTTTTTTTTTPKSKRS